ncbi:MAG: adenosine deaminase [Chloroflexota bacterium]
MTVESIVKAMPKAELHVHLEGAIQPSTLLQLAKRNGVALPTDSVDGLRDWFTYRDFGHFVEIYLTISRCLRRADNFELITYEFGKQMARQNVRYAEITFTPATHGLRHGIDFDTYFSGLSEGRKRARVDFGVEIQWVFDMVFSVDDPALTRRMGDYTVSAAIDGMDDGVVALGLGGIEIGHSFERIVPFFERARAAGLHVAPHAGETVGPESIWGAIRVLGAERIGHGVRAIEDPALVSYLAERRIPLEICPTSNMRLGIFPGLDQHPLRALRDAGVVVTINSDDPPLFNTTLNRELLLLHDAFSFDTAAIEEIVLNGVRCSFLEETRKNALDARFRAELRDLARGQPRA